VMPDHTQTTVTLQSTAPLHWEASFPATQVGTYLLQVTWQSNAKNDKSSTNRLTATSGMVVPYSPEYLTQGTDSQFMSQLARAGGGSVLSPSKPETAFEQNLQTVSTIIPLAFFLLILAALLLPIDIAARRLSSLEFLWTGYAWIRQRLRPVSAYDATETSKQKGKENTLGISLENVRTQRQTRQEELEQARKRLPGRPVATLERPPEVKESASKTSKIGEMANGKVAAASKTEGTMAERLLAAKRKRNGSNGSES
jgi:hypothetical protein